MCIANRLNKEEPSDNQIHSRQAFCPIGNLTQMCSTRKELVLELERGLSVSPLDVSKSQGTQNKKKWSIANMLISCTEMSVARYPQICRKLNDVVPGTKTVGYWTLCPCHFNDRQTLFLEKSSSFFRLQPKMNCGSHAAVVFFTLRVTICLKLK